MNEADVQAVPVEQLKWRPTGIHPWRRYFARMLDIIVNGTLFSLLVIVPFYRIVHSVPSIAEFFDWLDPHSVYGGNVFLSRLFSTVLSAAAAILPNAFLLGYTGLTLGKWLLGVKLLDESGRPIGFKQAFLRECRILCDGIGFGIPLISLFTISKSYEKLKQKKALSWDEPQHVMLYRSNGVFQYALATVGVALYIYLIGVAYFM